MALLAPVSGPSKVIAAGSNYGDRVAEVHAVQERTLGRVEAWMMNFDGGGKGIPVEKEMDAGMGCTAGLDITVRSAADRSRRRSYVGFSPLGPWLVAADELGNGSDLDISVVCDVPAESDSTVQRSASRFDAVVVGKFSHRPAIATEIPAVPGSPRARRSHSVAASSSSTKKTKGSSNQL
ncbi:fumarylacetoacetate hydrolase family protein [Pseudonocardia sp. MH-G8]|uniref:fumarylacetoacetate hydrolase family protein n=1 Tax=Pseudonocardia sp. MH-G8 TaxID=1854588 RepID=UPI00117B651A|nr:fumarylacetoacetate hydrolase family protein [Pseudonocardia sp. MH-G8]